jgi:S-adenosylmethionine:tRNA ribosyltransferase-isomerase
VNAATWPRSDRKGGRLLHVERRSGAIVDHPASDLPLLLGAEDVVIVNDAATLPASLTGRSESGAPIELRLVGDDEGTWQAVVFGAGNWRTPTERRPEPPLLAAGTRLHFPNAEAALLSATIEQVLPPSPRLLRIRFDRSGAELWASLYRSGRPVQYAYMNGPLELWHVQNRFAARPWAVEAPSAGFILSGQVLMELRRRGVALAAITHAAGLSASGDDLLDRALPLGERFDIPEATVSAVLRARARGGNVIAIGTSVVRALEAGALERGTLSAGQGRTELRIGPGFVPRIVHGLLSGIHDPAASHYALLEAFAPPAQLDEARNRAEALGYLEHEFGDACLIL